MPADSARMLELRRRVQTDPASITFAQLAEECRRVGSNEEAVEICRAGLARNPAYLSARVTLGRALIELGQLDAAQAELDIVVAGVPDNLAAIRGLAEILQRRGQMKEALEYYKRALELAKHDRDLEDTVVRISQEVSPAPPPQPAGPQVSIEEIFNFDTLIDQLGLPSASAVEGAFGATSPKYAVESSASEGGPEAPAFEDFFAEIGPEPMEVPGIDAAPSMLDSAELRVDDTDSLAVMERELRELEAQRGQDELRARAELEAQRAQDEQRARLALAQRRRDAMVGALEKRLSAIVADRERHSA